MNLAGVRVAVLTVSDRVAAGSREDAGGDAWQALELLADGRTPKGDVLGTARTAGILAAMGVLTHGNVRVSLTRERCDATNAQMSPRMPAAIRIREVRGFVSTCSLSRDFM